MTTDHDSQPFDAILARSYEQLRAADPQQREAVLAGYDTARRAAPARPTRAWRRPLAWAATAACLAVVAVGAALLLPSSAKVVYGIEAVPGRLAEVQTIRQRGYVLVYDHRNPAAPPIRVPLEYLLKRPDKYRMTTYTTRHRRDAPPEVTSAVGYCDGQMLSAVFDEAKQCDKTPVALLEAWIQTELRAQILIGTMFGPADATYKKVGSEEVARQTVRRLRRPLRRSFARGRRGVQDLDRPGDRLSAALHPR